MSKFVWTDELRGVLSQYFHMSAAYVKATGTDQEWRYRRRLWAAERFSKEHPECSSTGAYKELDRAEAWRQHGQQEEA